VSSTYKAICLSHDPAIEIGREDYDDDQWTDRETALGALTRRTGFLAAHKDCDLVVGAYSYPLVEITCPASSGRRVAGIKDGSTCCHNYDKSIPVDWLRLLIAALIEPTAATTAVLSPRQIDLCWVPQRVMRLQNLLGVEGDRLREPVVARPCGASLSQLTVCNLQRPCPEHDRI